jgi:uncharacterized protein YdeI (YjbR/CyaY-like superfamily)
MARKAVTGSIEIPQELLDVLHGDPQAAAAFGGLPPSHKREYADWIAGAKKAETKRSRAAKAVEMFRDGKRSFTARAGE